MLNMHQSFVALLLKKTRSRKSYSSKEQDAGNPKESGFLINNSFKVQPNCFHFLSFCGSFLCDCIANSYDYYKGKQMKRIVCS